MAKIDVIMPQMGESIAEGTLSRWMKKIGEEVKRDEPIFEISTDKVDAEIPSPSGGTLVEILVQEGQTVPVQTVVARIESEKGAAASVPAPAATPTAPAAPPPPPPAATAPPAPAARPAAPPPALPPAAAAPASPTGPETAEERLRRRSTPLVRKMAAEHNLDITAIPGTGHAGRVTKSDVLAHLEQPAHAPAPAAPAAAKSPAPGVTTISGPVVEPWPGDKVEPWSRIRKLTADHMVMSRRVSAHVSSYFDVDYTHITKLRAKKKQEYASRGVNLTYLAFIAKAVADNIRKHPIVNAAVSSDATIYRNEINIGIAVALEWGLIVPVIKHADELSLLGIARAINDLGERARTKKLNPDEVQRGTFTITNPGVFGGVIGFPIINQPQVAILGVGGISKQPAVITLPDGTDVIAVRTKGIISMTYDHRVVDGADGDRFLADVKKTLESFPESAV
jgi:2-oxoglutarate dehydrogenase E2 component (dihydrolipoamide succinyltransferase)